MSHHNGSGTHAVKKALADVHFEDVKETLQGATKTVEKELNKAGKAASRAADSMVKTAKANPLAAAGVLVGAGALLGALLYSVLRPAPTASEVIMRALKRGAEQTQDGVMAGWNSARRAIKA